MSLGMDEMYFSKDEDTGKRFIEFNNLLGLIVGRVTEEILKNNVLITDGYTDEDGIHHDAGVYIRDGENVLARFNGDEIKIGATSFLDNADNKAYLKNSNGIYLCAKGPGESGFNMMPKLVVNGSGVYVDQGVDGTLEEVLTQTRLAPKLLWTGTLSKDGSVVVPGITGYSLFGARTSDGATMMLGLRTYKTDGTRDKQVRFVGAYDDGNSTSSVSSGSLVFKANTEITDSTNTFKLIQCSLHKLTSSGCQGKELSIVALFGIF